MGVEALFVMVLEHGLSSEYAFDYFVEMDCDFSHPPASVLEGVVKLGNQVLTSFLAPDILMV